ncbi:hypothetical protein GCM10010499_06910 [Streptomyces thermoviolaceus subsp. apingens]|nr:hypothetical protein GCM10010499_06910 [Streptomyces thermoviolaceus subsp. apingens]
MSCSPPTADRRARVLERKQIALLRSFAAWAAAAIDSANLLTETRAALADLERANEIIRDRSAVIERASDVHDRLAELVLRGGGVHDVAAAVLQVLDGTVEFTETTAAPAAPLEASRGLIQTGTGSTVAWHFACSGNSFCDSL